MIINIAIATVSFLSSCYASRFNIFFHSGMLQKSSREIIVKNITLVSIATTIFLVRTIIMPEGM